MGVPVGGNDGRGIFKLVSDGDGVGEDVIDGVGVGV